MYWKYVCITFIIKCSEHDICSHDWMRIGSIEQFCIIIYIFNMEEFVSILLCIGNEVNTAQYYDFRLPIVFYPLNIKWIFPYVMIELLLYRLCVLYLCLLMIYKCVQYKLECAVLFLSGFKHCSFFFCNLVLICCCF